MTSLPILGKCLGYVMEKLWNVLMLVRPNRCCQLLHWGRGQSSVNIPKRKPSVVMIHSVVLDILNENDIIQVVPQVDA